MFFVFKSWFSVDSGYVVSPSELHKMDMEEHAWGRAVERRCPQRTPCAHLLQGPPLGGTHPAPSAQRWLPQRTSSGLPLTFLLSLESAMSWLLEFLFVNISPGNSQLELRATGRDGL